MCQVTVGHFVTLTEDSAAPGSKSSGIVVQRLDETFCIMEESMSESQYAAIALTAPCTSFMQILLNKCVIFSQALTVAPLRWFLRKPKHVGA